MSGRPDPRAVRAGIAPASRLDGDPIVVLAPAPPSPGGHARPAAQLLVDGVPTPARLDRFDDERAILDHEDDGAQTRTSVLFGPPRLDRQRGIQIREVVIDGWRFEVELEAEQRALLRERARRGTSAAVRGGPVEIRAIIPGRVVAVFVGAGDAVEAGQQVLVVEAMKMQNELRAPREGIVERVGVAVGATIEVGDLLVVLH